MKSSWGSVVLVAVLAGQAAVPSRAETVRVFAAASLNEAFRDIGSLYRTQNPGDEVEFNFAGSEILRTQIEEGAPADVFAAADHVHMEALQGKGLVGQDVVFARNRLVVVTPSENPEVQQLVDLARPGERIVVASGNVPVGRYTTQVLGKMTRSGLYGADFHQRFLANVVSQETNVRAVLAKVSLGEADAGVVYATDARTVAEKVRVLEIPENMNVVAEYPIATISRDPAKEGAARFVALVRSEAGQAFLVKRGFEPAP